MLAEMKYLNISHELPQISIHQEQALAIKNTFRPAELHRHYDPPLADVAATLVEVDIDTYNSRKAYGFLNHDDFAKKYGGEGFSDVQANTSRLTRSAWNYAKNGAHPGANLIGNEAKSRLRGEILQWPKWEAVKIPDPEFTVHPSEIKGRMDPGSDTTSIQSTATPEIEIRPGSAQTTLAKKGYVNQWISVGRYDMRV
ncbi:hypothetical protein D081_1116 [Anaerovibrio sp. JC8]|uniref:DUF6470 family protein n=1 Tax=Anaerovibrio sp. JC8 TaxID=1240085 RepID=UPI000A0DEDD5|nr:DUF6470 family protein [Anaerovibrio sp. JC8]ORU00593.1 hypothetical protein D081_1116 [Anaerovibrio sp. JC8]